MIVGEGAVLGGRVGVAAHLKIGAWAVVAAAACVGTSVPAGAVYAGYPAVPGAEAMENLKLMRRVRRLLADLPRLGREVSMASRPTETTRAGDHDRDDRRRAQEDNCQTGPLGAVGGHAGVCIVGNGICDLDVTAGCARARPIRTAVSNAFAFGGTNAVVAVKRFDE